MTIAYGIALAMNWDRPYWAGFAVAFISLSTIGQSLNKGVLRMIGTLVALMISLLIIALFVQDRWWFMVTLSGWVGFCTYRKNISNHSYFWFVAGFASVVIAFDGGTDPVNAFNTAVLRAQETGLGVLVYTLVSTLLWPTSSRAGFENTTRALVQTQHQLYSSYRARRAGRKPEQNKPGRNTQTIAAQYVQLIAQFGTTLDAALTDSSEVREWHHQWRRFLGDTTALFETLERWHESRKEFEEIDLFVLLPNLEAAMEEFEQRFAEIERLFAGNPPQHQPQSINLSTSQTRLQELSHFHKAAFLHARTGLQRLDKLTRNQLNTLLEIKGFSSSTQHSAVPLMPPDKPGTGPLPDPDSMIAAIRAMASLWLVYLLWIYVKVPGGSGIVSAAGAVGMMLATAPRLPVVSILKPVLYAIALAGILYVFVMPKLSSFVGLGSMIFFVVFTITYLFSKPQQGMTRSIGLAIFLMIIGVSNQQQYNFLSVADTAVMFILLVGMLILGSWIPFSPQPDKTFLRLLGRFFRSSEYLVSTMRQDLTPTRLDYWRRAFHAREVKSLPQKLDAWGEVVDTRKLPGTTPEQVHALTTNFQALAYNMQNLMDIGANPQAELLVRELLPDVRTWRRVVQEILQAFSLAPKAGSADTLNERLTAIFTHLENRIEETMDKTREGELSDRDGENFYLLLGAYRGLSQAMIKYAGTAEGIEWDRWRKYRF